MTRSCLTAALLCALACARATAPPATGGPQPARLRGLDFSADLQVASTSPTELSGEVRVTNRGASPETLVFADGCPVRIRVYEVRGTRMAPVWQGPTSCPDQPVAVAIAPGQSVALGIPATTAREILRGELPDETYRVTVLLALSPEERVIEIEAGRVSLRTSG